MISDILLLCLNLYNYKMLHGIITKWVTNIAFFDFFNSTFYLQLK